MGMNTWITESLRNEIRLIFEPRYGRGLSKQEVIEIAENLTVAVEEILRFKWKQYEKITG